MVKIKRGLMATAKRDLSKSLSGGGKFTIVQGCQLPVAQINEADMFSFYPYKDIFFDSSDFYTTPIRRELPIYVTVGIVTFFANLLVHFAFRFLEQVLR